jgi:aspartate kinase
MIKVFKFGGALMQQASGIRKVASIINSEKGNKLVVVVSALGKTTNRLEEILQLAILNKEKEYLEALNRLEADHLKIENQLFNDAAVCKEKLQETFVKLRQELKNLDANRFISYDRVVGYGEKLSSLILSHYFSDKQLQYEAIDARKVIITDENYTSAKINWELTTKQIKSLAPPVLVKGKFILTEGFIGSDTSGNPTTLGREGSDFTAAIFASILEAENVTFWKNVPGLMHADPKRFAECIKLDHISYHEAIELAFYGASVIHPKTIQPLQKKGIPLFIRSFDDLDISASIISNDTSMDDKMHKTIVKDDQVLLSISSRDLSFIAEDHLTYIFKAFSRQKIHINLMQHSAVSFSVCFDNNANKLENLLTDLKNDFNVKYNEGLQLITIRHYTEKIINNLIKNKQIFLEQKSRSTVQLLIK